MPDIPVVTIEVAQYRTKKQQKLLDMLKDKEIQTEVNVRILNTINKFVPMKSGALRASGRATSNMIVWGEGLEYARYQYGGIVYGPNLPGLDGGTPAWRSRRGMKKYPTGRELGKRGAALLYPKWGITDINQRRPYLYTFGYTTPGTHHHWDKYFRYLPKMRTNLEITRFLKAECKRRGLKA